MNLFSRAFLADAVRRAVYTAAQAAIAVLGVGAGFAGVDWKPAGLTVLFATVMSLLTSVVRADNSGPAAPVTPVFPAVNVPAPSAEELASAYRGLLAEPQGPPNVQAPPSA